MRAPTLFLLLSLSSASLFAGCVTHVIPGGASAANSTVADTHAGGPACDDQFTPMPLLCSGNSTSALPVPSSRLEPFPAKLTGEHLQSVLAQSDVPNSRQDRPAIIFIPGILGSKLTKGGKTIWGQERVSAEDLVFDPAECPANVRAELLLDYQAIEAVHIYGQAITTMCSTTSGRQDLYAFPYDWRRDIRDAAIDLDKHLRSQEDLRDRDLVIVAHSQGGLVAWYWLQHYYTPQVHLKHLLLLGSPLDGSCEMVRIMAHGYEDIPANSEGLPAAPLDLVYKYYFSELRASAYTFPSIFELLPPETDQDRACVMDQTFPPRARNLLSEQEWELPQVEKTLLNEGALFSKSTWSYDFPNSSSDKAARDLFYQRRSKAIALAQAFRRELDIDRQHEQNVLLTIFVSENFKTVDRVIIDGSLGSFHLTVDPLSNSGDGRVPRRRAIPDSLDEAGRWFEVQYTHSDHGSLPDDLTFLEYLNHQMQYELQAWSAGEAAKKASASDQAVKTLANISKSPVDVHAVASLVPQSEREALTHDLKELNCKVARQSGLTWPEIRKAQKSEPAIDTAAASDTARDCGQLDQLDYIFNLNDAAFSRLEDASARGTGDGGSVASAQKSAALLAEPLLEKARTAYEEDPTKYDRYDSPAQPKQFAQGLYRNLGTAYCWTGDKSKAATYYKQARMAGHLGELSCP